VPALLDAVVRAKITESSSGPIRPTRLNQKIVIDHVNNAHSRDLQSFVVGCLRKYGLVAPAQHSTSNRSRLDPRKYAFRLDIDPKFRRALARPSFSEYNRIG